MTRGVDAGCAPRHADAACEGRASGITMHAAGHLIEVASGAPPRSRAEPHPAPTRLRRRPCRPFASRFARAGTSRGPISARGAGPPRARAARGGLGLSASPSLARGTRSFAAGPTPAPPLRAAAPASRVRLRRGMRGPSFAVGARPPAGGVAADLAAARRCAWGGSGIRTLTRCARRVCAAARACRLALLARARCHGSPIWRPSVHMRRRLDSNNRSAVGAMSMSAGSSVAVCRLQ